MSYLCPDSAVDYVRAACVMVWAFCQFGHMHGVDMVRIRKLQCTALHYAAFFV